MTLRARLPLVELYWRVGTDWDRRLTGLQVMGSGDGAGVRYNMVDRYTGVQVYRYTGIQIYRYTGIQVYRYTGIQVYRYTRYTGIQGMHCSPGGRALSHSHG